MKPIRKRARRHLPIPVLHKFNDHPLVAVTARNLLIDAQNLELVANKGNTEMRGIVKNLRAAAAFYTRLQQERV